jgi:acyl-CoA synthetase (AMP-forming)/AMP-acid ligase II
MNLQRGADGVWSGPPLDELPPSALWELVEAHVARAPQTAWGFHCDGELTRFTSRELVDEARRVAAGFARLGLAPGDAVVAQLPNCREGTVAFFAALALGLKYVPVVHIYGPSELAFIVGNARARLLITPAKWHNVDFVERLRRLPRLESLRATVVTGSSAPRDLASLTTWDALAGSDAAPATLPRVDPQSACLICYTSGTTAMPKGAMHSHRSLAAEVRQNVDYLRHIDNKNLFVGAPAGHIGPITMMLRQVVFDVSGAYLDRWDALVAAALIEEFRAGWTVGVPMHLSSLLPLREAGRIRNLESYVIGGTSVPPAIVEAADRVGIRACRSYGSTEHPTIAQCQLDQPLRERAWTDGSLASGAQIRLVDDEGRDVPDGASGEVISRGPERFLGYFDAALNADAFTSDGWFRTGDIAVIDQQGLLTVVDRKKDILIRGGENIAAKEVEDILTQHAEVLEAAVVGWPDPAYGERVGAFVRLRPGGALDIESLRRHFEAVGVARQKIPERLVIVDDFPRNPSGKIMKTELRQRARAAAGQSTGTPQTP